MLLRFLPFPARTPLRGKASMSPYCHSKHSVTSSSFVENCSCGPSSHTASPGAVARTMSPAVSCPGAHGAPCPSPLGAPGPFPVQGSCSGLCRALSVPGAPLAAAVLRQLCWLHPLPCLGSSRAGRETQPGATQEQRVPAFLVTEEEKPQQRSK